MAGNSFFEAALGRMKSGGSRIRKSIQGGLKKYAHGGTAAPDQVRKFDPKVREELKRFRKEGGRKVLTGQKTRMGVTPDEASTIAGSNLHPSLWKRARQGKTSIPR